MQTVAVISFDTSNSVGEGLLNANWRPVKLQRMRGHNTERELQRE